MSKMRSQFHAWFFQEDWADRIQRWMALFLQLAIFGVLIGSVRQQHWLVSFTAIIVLALTFLPAIIERQLQVILPVEFTLVTCLFLFLAFGLGEVSNFYHKYWWWDLMLHTFSALVMGLIGFLLVYIFYMTHRIQMSPLYVAIVSFCFAITVGTIWEIAEFLLDWYWEFNLQKSGLVDTMTDLLVNALGGLVAGYIGFEYVRGGDSLIADRIVRRFVKKNPRLFKTRIKKSRNDAPEAG